MRRISRIIIGMFCAAIVNAMLPSTLLAGELTDTEFLELHKQLQSAPDEPWRTIPWKIALLDAQRDAVKEKKPIFIWAMDGHPLGCT